MEQTEKYQLSQWEQSDRIQMEDFNSDNAKVEEALAALAERLDSQIYTTSYTGTGISSRTMTFPRKPIMVVVVATDGGFMILFPFCRGGGIVSYPATGTISAYGSTVQGNSVTWHNRCNTSGETHYVFALLQA